MSDNPSAIIAPAGRPVAVLELEAPAACTCGATLPPSGDCLELGACEIADAAAVRGAARVTSKYAVPAAWNVRGAVD